MRISLDGIWKLRWNDGQRGDQLSRLLEPEPDLSRALDARVPGEVHLDLLAAGVIEEPGLALNHLAVRWVEEARWGYWRAFDAPALAEGQHAWLVFEELLLDAAIFLNGQQIGTHANGFYPCRIDVSGALRSGRNTLLVVIEAGLFAAADRPGGGYGLSPDSALAKRNWHRTVQSAFGWDWSPRLLNVGITGSVSLEIASGARLETLVALAELSPDLAQGAVTARLFVEGLADCPQSGHAQVALEGHGSRVSVEAEVAIQPGLQLIDMKLELPQPALWWPVGHGEQPLYTVRVRLSLDGKLVDTAERRVGFRHMEVDQSRHEEGGRYFAVTINGKRIFCKGGNFVPADIVWQRAGRERYAMLVDRALEANCNLLRVWGGGLYERDAFYDLCDERGVLVWQEFIFACAKYPLHDAEFLADVRREATYQIRRLASHASLIVLCGNNEMEWIGLMSDAGYDKGVAYPDYALFHMVLPQLVRREGGVPAVRYFQPSSPFSPDHLEPNRDDVGDQHPWSIGFADTDFRKYREMTCRFPNEGGILGPTALPTVLACLPAGSTAQSPLAPAEAEPRATLAWEQHDNSVAYWGGARPYPDAMLEQWLGRSRHDMTVEEYVYWAGVVQGEGLTEYIRNFRRRMFSTASAVFWMYNDCWPAVRSWTIVDYYGRRTPAFWPVRRMFRPLIVVVAPEGDRIKMYGVNEGPEWRGEVRFGLFALAGGYPVDERRVACLPTNCSTLLGELDLAELTRRGEQTHGAFAILSQGGREVARDRLFLPLFKEMAWPHAEVRVRTADNMAILESDVFAWRICLDLDGEQPIPDNFFDVLPGTPTVLEWPEGMPAPRVLRIGNGLA